jgi:hypothetical protein
MSTSARVVGENAAAGPPGMGEAMLRTQQCGGASSLQFYPNSKYLVSIDTADFHGETERKRGGSMPLSATWSLHVKTDES